MKPLLSLCALFVFLSSGVTRAETVSVLERPLPLEQGETKILSLPREVFVHKLFIQAIATSSEEAYLEVSVKGDIKGTLYLPGHDPHYVVTIEQSTRSIEVSAIRGRARLVTVEAVISPSGLPQPFPTGSHTRMGQNAIEAIWAEDRLESHSNYDDIGEFLLPVRKTAALAYAIAEAQGDSSGSARPYYEQFLVSLDHARPFLNKTFEVHEAFELAVRLTTITERVRELLK